MNKVINLNNVLKNNFNIDMLDILPWAGVSIANEKTIKELSWFDNFIKNNKGKTLNIVEVGVRNGEMLVFILKLCKKYGIKSNLYGIDLWEKCNNTDGDNTLTYRNIKSFFELRFPEINLMQGDSADSSTLFGDNSMDLVIVDACHDYNCVKKDLIAWLPKVKKNGFLLAHDVISFEGPRKAWIELFNQLNVIDENSKAGYGILNRKEGE